MDASPAPELRGTWLGPLAPASYRRRGRDPDAEERSSRSDVGRPMFSDAGQSPEQSLYMWVVRETVREALNDGSLDGSRLDAVLWLVDPRPRSDYRVCCQLAGISDHEQFRAALLRSISDPLVQALARNARRCFQTLLLAPLQEGGSGRLKTRRF